MADAFNAGKCRVMHIGYNKYFIDGVKRENVNEEKDLVVIIN